MSIVEFLAAALVIAGVIVVWLAALALVFQPSALDRLHAVGLAGAAGVALIVSGAIVAHPTDQFGLKAALVAIILWCFGPVLSHVQAALAYRTVTTDRQPAVDESGDAT